ncbi:hypothetical protein K504DRAFT_377640 [Pleomassaria siparia CBS 279.74]|uniref:FAD-binding FR-type domain-containing protein n=1 Tax=Pleomassaria siparia CBS 279.74 TaxID=1314801 RepID=A0A6G1KDS5_9PLEO|nr:hypothetical protein K504DRAFT_377640 [Pleomassaria siparia CBS 279.74]
MVSRYVFQLPGSRNIVESPISQHVAIKAIIDGKLVQRSYTPTTNNPNRDMLKLVIKIYEDSQSTGDCFANLKVGDEVLFSGPKGSMR